MNEAERFLRERLARKQAAQSTAPGSAHRSTGARPVYADEPPPWKGQGRPPFPEDSARPAGGPQRMATFREAWVGFWTQWTHHGRASRAEFWWITLFNMGLGYAMTFAYPFVWELEPNAADILSLFTGLYTLAAFGPSIGVQIRRLHDAGFSGWWWWLFFFPFFGWLFLLILYTLPSTPTPNRYGPVPWRT